jgi:hypothetical protein
MGVRFVSEAHPQEERPSLAVLNWLILVDSVLNRTETDRWRLRRIAYDHFFDPTLPSPVLYCKLRKYWNSLGPSSLLTSFVACPRDTVYCTEIVVDIF